MRLKAAPPAPEPELLRKLDHRARIVLGLFAKQETITATQVAETLTGFKTGKIEEGYLADICLIDLNRPEMTPNFNVKLSF